MQQQLKDLSRSPGSRVVRTIRILCNQLVSGWTIGIQYNQVELNHWQHWHVMTTGDPHGDPHGDPCPIGQVFGADLIQIIFRSLPSSSSSCPCR